MDTPPRHLRPSPRHTNSHVLHTNDTIITVYTMCCPFDVVEWNTRELSIFVVGPRAANNQEYHAPSHHHTHGGRL